MKRFGLFLITVITLIGCASGVNPFTPEPEPGYPPYDFDGIWTFSSQVIRNDCGAMVATSGTAFIEYEEGESVISISGSWGQGGDLPDIVFNEPHRLIGTCDSMAGTFSIPYISAQGMPAIWEGRTVDDYILTGRRKSSSGCYFEISWTAKKAQKYPL